MIAFVVALAWGLGGVGAVGVSKGEDTRKLQQQEAVAGLIGRVVGQEYVFVRVVCVCVCACVFVCACVHVFCVCV